MSPGPFNPDYSTDGNPLPMWMRWLRTSPTLLLEAEEKLLKRLKSCLDSSFVPIFNETCYIRTLVARNFSAGDKNSVTKSHQNVAHGNSKIPMVMIHGFASGIALWCKNLDSLAEHRAVYTFDLLGFGRSSRPPFPDDPKEAEKKFVDSVEEWRNAMKLEKFILLGHSLGGFIAASYAIAHPNRIAHLVLVDPWGFFGLPWTEEAIMKNNRKAWLIRTFRNANPLSILRAVGPVGQKLIHHVRQDLRFVFDQRSSLTNETETVPEDDSGTLLRRSVVPQLTTNSEQLFDSSNQFPASKPLTTFHTMDMANPKLSPADLDGSAALDYVYQINVQRPSGEVGFKSMCSFVGYAKHPMVLRIGDLDRQVPVTFIYGSRSWLDISSGVKTRDSRPKSYVDIKVIEGAGHQVYAEAADEFNAYVNTIAEQVDRGLVCTPVPLGEHEERYMMVKSQYMRTTTSIIKTNNAGEQRIFRSRPMQNDHLSADGRCDGSEQSRNIFTRLSHEASDEDSD